MPRSFLFALALSACSFSPSTGDAPVAPNRELRTFSVPDGAAQETTALLESVVAADGQVALGPDGRVVVVADATLMPGIERLVAQLADAGVQAPPRVHMQYWLVLGEPAAEATVAPELAALRPVLDEVVATQAPMAFSLVERLSVRGESGERVEVAGLRAAVWQTASVRGDAVVADVHIEPEGGARVQTRVQLRPDQTLVMGETGVDPALWGRESRHGQAPAVLYYVVRPTVEGAPGDR